MGGRQLIPEPVMVVYLHTTEVPKTCYACSAVPTKFYKGMVTGKKYGTCEAHKIERAMST
jgi:hypothetical protein